MSQLTFGAIPEPPTGSGCPGHLRRCRESARRR